MYVVRARGSNKFGLNTEETMFSLTQRLLLENPEAAILVAFLTFVAALIRWRNDAMTRRVLRKAAEELKQVAEKLRNFSNQS